MVVAHCFAACFDCAVLCCTHSESTWMLTLCACVIVVVVTAYSGRNVFAVAAHAVVYNLVMFVIDDCFVDILMVCLCSGFLPLALGTSLDTNTLAGCFAGYFVSMLAFLLLCSHGGTGNLYCHLFL